MTEERRDIGTEDVRHRPSAQMKRSWEADKLC
jgi:hypothetical protein